MPDALRNDRDWTLFQAALDRAELVVVGRASHEAAPNPKRRRRLVVSRQVSGLSERDDAAWLNPDDVSLDEALERLVPQGGEIAVPGGQAVFDLIGPSGFAEFHLATARGVLIPDGVGLFRICEMGVSPEALLAGGGLLMTGEVLIDALADVALALWERPGPE